MVVGKGVISAVFIPDNNSRPKSLRTVFSFLPVPIPVAVARSEKEVPGDTGNIGYLLASYGDCL